MTKEFYTPAEIEQIFGIKKPILRTWARQGRIKAFKVGRLVLIPVEDFKSRFSRLNSGRDFFDKETQ